MKGRIRMAFMVVLSFAVLLVPSLAPATYVDFGPGIITGSWSQAINESGVGNFDKIEAFMLTPGVNFEAPGISNFTAAGWSGSLVNPNYALGTGTATNNTNFNLYFTSDTSTPFTMNLLAWNGLTVVDKAQAYWNGGGWQFTGMPLEAGNYDRSPVPIPGAVWLLGSGLLGLVGIGRKRLKKV